MDKPIRSLRDVYMGIKKDYSKRKQNREKVKESSEESLSSNPSYETCQEEEEVEMDFAQKKILEDKVINVITHWNDINFIKENSETFIQPEKRPPKEEVKEPPKEVKKKYIGDRFNMNETALRENKSVKLKKLRSATKSKKKNFVASDTKFFKNPVPEFENKKVFLFSEAKREKPLRKITFNEKMRKMKMISETKAYYQIPSTKNTRERNSNKITVNNTFVHDKQKKSNETGSQKKVFGELKTSLSPSASMIYQNSFYKSNYSNFRQNQLINGDFHNSYSSNWRGGLHIKKRKIKSREQHGIEMKESKLNVSSQPRIPIQIGARIVGRRKELHNIKVKKTKNNLQSIMTIKNHQMCRRTDI